MYFLKLLPKLLSYLIFSFPLYNGPMKFFPSPHNYYMNQCLALAEMGRLTVSPNPMVGAVVLDAHGKKVSEGYHVKAGGDHAEVVALNLAGDAAKGGSLYVNLEPCSHTGRTPPCTEKIIQSGIQFVYCGTLDPNPLVAGRGKELLQHHQISVRHGFLEDDCYTLNESFFHYIQTKTPFVTLKLAMTLDGKIASRSGKSHGTTHPGSWITGPLARTYVHQLRQEQDAILTTAQTVLEDDPLLNVRLRPGENDDNHGKQPIRLVLDRQLRLDIRNHKIFQDETTPTWLVTSGVNKNKPRLKLAESLGIPIILINETQDGLDLKELLQLLGAQEISRLMVEAGGRLASSFLNQGLFQKAYLFYAPKILGDEAAQNAFAGGINIPVPEFPQLKFLKTHHLDTDHMIEAYPAVN
jgi:diaminohydroxyphosphoribosylaminopyrimidine deaminase / 5-amino-6-(5-phosphoribosylamino)uracil reductase